MTDERTLLAAVVAAPDDDTPRLAYADWLDEHGQPDRAEFIRVQCRIARGAAAFGDEERAFELEERNRGWWLVGLPGGEGVAWTFRRGFPEEVEAPLDVFLERYDRYAAVPWLRSLCLFDVWNRDVRDFVSRPWNPHWIALELGPSAHNPGGLTPALIALADSPQSRRLSRLRFPWLAFTPEAVEALATSPYLGGLRELIVWGDYYAPLFDSLRERFGSRLTGDLRR